MTEAGDVHILLRSSEKRNLVLRWITTPFAFSFHQALQSVYFGQWWTRMATWLHKHFGYEAL